MSDEQVLDALNDPFTYEQLAQLADNDTNAEESLAQTNSETATEGHEREDFGNNNISDVLG